MKAINSGAITNNKSIKVFGVGAAMLAQNDSLGINNGLIDIEGGIQDFELEYWYEKSDDPNDYYDGVYTKSYGQSYENVTELIGESGSEVENSKTGIIKMSGRSKGIHVSGEGTKGVNNGLIEGTSVEEEYTLEKYDIETKKLLTKADLKTYSRVDGMFVRGNSTIINGENGVMRLNGTTRGMDLDRGATDINDGKIILTAFPIEIDAETGENYEWTNVFGLRGRDENSNVTNNGLVNIINSGMGIQVTDGAIGENNETIKLEVEITSVNLERYTELSGLYALHGGNVKNNKDELIDIDVVNKESKSGSGEVAVYGINNRNIKSLEGIANSDFESYGIGISSEIGRKFGEERYVKPYLGLDITHLGYESFTETGESLNVEMDSHSLNSILPKVGIELGVEYNEINLFVGTEYSYELENIDKAQKYKFKGDNDSLDLYKDNLEGDRVDLKVGVKTEINKFDISLEFGQRFADTDNLFGKFTLGYKF